MRVSTKLVLCSLWSFQSVFADADFDQVRTGLSKNYNNLDTGRPQKYFHEATFDKHYDGRFGDHALTYEERRERISYLIQSFLLTMNNIGAETWLMHGTLLNWWWNHQAMPWETHLDVMVSEQSMQHLAQSYNMSVHRQHLPNLLLPRAYMLEVNPHYTSAGVDADNPVDARWIDTEVGLYIDISTLRSKSATSTSYSSKDGHEFHHDDIFPLLKTTFEGVPARIPAAYPDLLIEEFGEPALSKVNFEGHTFEMRQDQWIPHAQQVMKTRNSVTAKQQQTEKKTQASPGGGL